MIKQLLLLSLLALMVYACMDDNRLFSREDLPPKVSEAQMWYENQVVVDFLPFKPLGGGENELTPDWSKMFSNQNDEYKVPYLLKQSDYSMNDTS